MIPPVTSTPDVGSSDAHQSPQHGSPEPATDAQQHLDEHQHTGWLRAGPEVSRAPATHSPSKRAIGLSALAILVTGLAGAVTTYVLTPGPTARQSMTPPPAARPQAQLATSGVLTTIDPSAAPQTPMAASVTSATASNATVTPASPVLAPLAPTPEKHVPRAGGTPERRSGSRPGQLASPLSPASAIPGMTTAQWPSSQDGDQKSTAQSAPPSQDQQDQHSQWHWQKTTTCDSSGRCVDHYNPAPSDQ
jgi:hypothetical protein